MIKVNKCVIIGGGIAGLSASIYAARFNMNPIVFTENKIGGLLNYAKNIENYPGFINIKGKKLINIIKKQTKKLGTIFNNKNTIKKIIFKKKVHKIILNNNKIIKTNGIIIATGSKNKNIKIKNHKKYIGRGISYCAICDGIFYKKKNIVIIGGGETAIENAIYLANICNKIYIIIRKNKFKASYISVKKIKKYKNIIIKYNYILKTIKKTKNIIYIKIYNKINNINENIKISGIFISIGYKPNTKFFKNTKLKLNNQGYIITNNTKTNIPGIYACGDVIDNKYKQISIASSTGIIAAINLYNYLNN
ncbi:MAG: NAD(P)/FAD-dependent oxidoreductase [Candidatus Shikimatogenerans sp. Tduv]|uniref:FAD-dependent oxidoreductase n=1 Tax=Candidatus Shikimatogenerans sp. Tduv TaxID=3158567 RepID=A0AAU7QTQ5_9FLAO